jgi:hypothetical protein
MPVITGIRVLWNPFIFNPRRDQLGVDTSVAFDAGGQTVRILRLKNGHLLLVRLVRQLLETYLEEKVPSDPEDLDPNQNSFVLGYKKPDKKPEETVFDPRF